MNSFDHEQFWALQKLINHPRKPLTELKVKTRKTQTEQMNDKIYKDLKRRKKPPTTDEIITFSFTRYNSQTDFHTHLHDVLELCGRTSSEI